MPDRSDRLSVAFQSALGSRYSLERELGRGGMGIVYLAHEARLERPVAIKLLPPVLAAQPALRKQLLAEARTAAKLSHPNIIPIHAVDEAGEFAYFAMAYVPGETLGARLRRSGALPPFEAARILREVAWALAYAHARGVVHRDVKPDNILLEAETGRTLVADFGIARRVEATGLVEGGLAGTPEYMSPEQACGEPVDGRSDLYSLGVVGYYALTGALPFRGATVGELVGQHVSRAPVPLTEAAPAVPPAIAAAVERCLAKQPGDRYPTSEAFVEAIDTALAAERRVPMAVRVFLSEARRRTAFRAFTAWLTALAVVPAGLWLLVLGAFRGRTPPHFVAGIEGVAGLLVLLALLTPLVRLVDRGRRLLAVGLGRAELLQALRLDLAERREEVAFAGGGAPSRLERGLRVTAYGALGVAAVAGGLAFVAGYPAVLGVFALFGGSAGVAVAAAIVARELAGRRGTAREERRLAFWDGPAGRTVFRLAALGSGGTARGNPA
jgi:eukaryotic-like serine/threonine-protein kinase